MGKHVKKKFLLVREQSGGCDYTIGCGVAVAVHQAESLDALMESMRADVVGSYGETYGIRIDLRGYGDGVSRATVYEIADEREVPIDEWDAQLRAAIAKEETAEEEQQERAEFERLKSKYGAKP